MAFSSPTDAYTATDLAAMIPEVWTGMLQEWYPPEATIINFVTDLSSFVSSEGDICNVPGIYTNLFTVNTQSTQGAAVVDESVAMTNTTLTVDTHKYVAFIMGDKDIRQMLKSAQVHDAYAREAARLLVRAMEDSLFALWSSFSTNTVGATSDGLTDLDIRTAIEDLDGTDYPLSDVAFFVHPYVYWLQLAAIQKYWDRSQNGMESAIKVGAFGAMSKGAFKGKLYDIPVFTSSRVVSGLQTYRNILMHRTAMGIALQTVGGGRFRVQSDYLLTNLGLLTVVDCIYGVAMLREAAGVLLNANTSTTAS